MDTIKKSITIKAPKEKVWEILTNEPFRDIWMSEFSENSQVGGEYKEGEDLIFLDATGQGLKARVKKLTEYTLVELENIANIKNGIEDTSSSEFEAWKGTGDTYMLTDINGDTSLKIESSIPSGKEQMFTDLWNKALKKIKEIAEE
jgi:uncharacterized protein YndB with AHSA1/START domain